MATLVIVGAQWGDEAKGKLADVLAENANLVIRYNGGANAGHTVKVGDKTYKFHLLPTGALRDNLLSVISSGVAFEPLTFQKEMLAVGCPSPDKVKISLNTHVVLPYHILMEEIDEDSRGSAKIGTTLRGIGPCYTDKTSRWGIRVSDFIDLEKFAVKLKLVLAAKNPYFKAMGKTELTVEKIINDYRAASEFIKPYAANTDDLIYNAVSSGKNVLFEGAQGTLLDIDCGTYPFVTSSHPISGGACLGTGIGPTAINAVLGVAKAYTTRVGSGPFPTELNDVMGEAIREKGQEFGTTTGRARRCGWLDLVALRYGVRVNGMTSLALTRLDVLDEFETISVCPKYKVDGVLTDSFNNDIDILSKSQPVLKDFKGWQTDTTKAKKWDDLPVNAQVYLRYIEEYIGIPISIVSIGPERTQTIIHRPDLLWK